MEVAPGIEEAVATLRSAEIGLGIVCDVGLTPSPTLRRRLAGPGAAAAPSMRGRSATRRGGSSPPTEAYSTGPRGARRRSRSDAAHVGDSRRTDMAGAIALGMTAVRFTAFHDHAPETGPEGDHVIDDHRRLPALLGVG